MTYDVAPAIENYYGPVGVVYCRLMATWAKERDRPPSVTLTRVEQAADPKMHVLSGALVAQPRYPLLVLKKYSADSNKLTGHRKYA